MRAGKVRAVGVSNFRAPLMRQAYTLLAQRDIPLASNQVHYNLLYRHPETNGVLDACRELEVALIPYSPLEQGIPTGKFRGKPSSRSLLLRVVGGSMRRLDPFGDTRGSVSSFQRVLHGSYTLPQACWESLFVVLEEIARAHEKTIAQIALNWLLGQDACIISEERTPGQRKCWCARLATNTRRARANQPGGNSLIETFVKRILSGRENPPDKSFSRSSVCQKLAQKKALLTGPALLLSEADLHIIDRAFSDVLLRREAKMYLL